MATFVLVHGASHGGWCWNPVLDRLRAAGHRASAPTLTGLGERAHLLTPAVDLETHVADVMAHIEWEELADVVLVGHSYGGMVVTGVADRMAGRLAALVYLDAFVPPDGRSLLDLQLPERVRQIRRLAEAEGEGWRVPARPAAVYGILDPAERARVDALLTAQPLAAYAQPLALAGAHERIRPRGYILAAHYRPSPFHAIHARLSGDASWRTYRLETGHDAMLTAPDDLVRILLEFAR